MKRTMTHTSHAPSATPASAPPPGATGRALPRWSAPAALAAILLLAAALYGWALGSLGWGNSYYAAAVKSMGRGWTNVVFGAYDPAGVLTVDKPPAALWPQVLSTKVFGLHGWAMLLPQVLEGVAAVLVLHRTVRRWAGEGAGLLAALVMTLTPITVAINRDNNPDTLLVLTLVAAAYALTRALQAPSGRSAVGWLCGSGFLVGAGFLTKMLAAWMVLPALAAAWLVGAAGTWLVRVRRLLVAGSVLAVSSLWWVALVALWPGDRPYIGGSEDGSAWDLVIGYNGLGRIFGENGATGGPGGASFGGAAGLGRLFNDQVGGQISWLLPLCAVALGVATAVAVLHRRGETATGAPLAASGWVLWGTWLVVCGLVFATQEGTFHPYYTTQLAPAVAALTAGLATALARSHRAGARWALPTGAGAVLVTVVWAVVVIERQPSWNGWLTWPVVAAGLGAAALLLLAGRRHRMLPAALGGAVLAVLLAPGAWAVSVPGSTSAMGGANHTAGPAPSGGMPFGRGAFPSGGPGGSGPGGLEPPGGLGGGTGGMPGAGSDDKPEGAPSGMPTFGGGGGGAKGGMGGMARLMDGTDLTADQRKILRYAVAHSGSARISLAADGGAMAASSYILNSDATVIGMGGFIGTDDAPSVDQLATWTERGELRYVLGSEPGSRGAGPGAMMGGADSPATRRSAWIADHCAKVPAAAYDGRADGSTGMMGMGTTLYDCAATKDAK
ncbi:glycosyl transferase, family 39 [Streptomyces himastatinicus ATCC 53653]|uniref:Glycosyl transferase, family 39 n=2 Tax=Streptomyces violaceusniger group TaxID=2839105 RepID=D9WMT5_9ACTN|nr:glycosyl transferase, family 39 [Streptomyces himastatinicus ATCC 53653]